MRRDFSRLGSTAFDLLIVGTGIYGACAAWDASQRGLSVALVDQDDFGAATSANSLRIIHGGLRYLGRGEFSRMRESIRERSTFLRIAPALVVPLPVLVPTYHRTRGRLAHRVALGLNDLVSWTRNRHLDEDRVIPPGRLVSRNECLRLFPDFVATGLTGGALWYDAQLVHPERLTFEFIRAAIGRGAVPANYARVDRLRISNGGVRGARVTDRLSETSLDVKAGAVLVAAGPWTADLIAGAMGRTEQSAPPRRHALGVNLVIGRRLADVAFGVRASSSQREDPVCGGRRFLFSAPQGKATVLGTWYTVADAADTHVGRERGTQALLQEFNQACPGLELSTSDVVGRQSGRLPLKAGLEPGRADALAERPRLVDHGATQGIRGLFSVEGVKYTTARRVAEQAIDRVVGFLGRRSPPCRTAEVRIDNLESGGLESSPGAGAEEIARIVREEMAVKLTDVVFRRTRLGAFPGPERTAVEAAACVMAAELGWDLTRQQAEIESVMQQEDIPRPTMEAVG